MAKKVDCLDELKTCLNDIEGWSVNDMARTVGRMIQGADKIASIIAHAADSMSDAYSSENPATPADINYLSRAMQSAAKAIMDYSSIYQWCISQGNTGEVNANMLEELIPHLDVQEIRMLQGWIDRVEAR